MASLVYPISPCAHSLQVSLSLQVKEGMRVVDTPALQAVARLTPLQSLLEIKKKKNRAATQGGALVMMKAKEVSELFLQEMAYGGGSSHISWLSAPGPATMLEGHLEMRTSLQIKERQLQEAQAALLAERQELQRATDALAIHQNELHVALSARDAIQEELLKARQECSNHSLHLSSLHQVALKWETEAKQARKALVSTQQELTSVKTELSHKNKALAKALLDITAAEQRLAIAQNLKWQYSMELIQLRKSLEEEETKSFQVDREIQEKKGVLQVAEAGLEYRTIAWLAAQDELRALASEHSPESSQKDLHKSNALLTQVRAELEASQRELKFFRKKLDMQERENIEHRHQLSCQKSEIEVLEARLAEVEHELAEERSQLDAACLACRDLERMVKEGQQRSEALKVELEQGKKALHACTLQVNSLQRELQWKDCNLSDTQLLLQIKQAELTSAKLEIQKLKSDMAMLQLVLIDRGLELELAQEMVRALQKEVLQLRSELKEKEEQLSRTTLLLKQREEQLDAMTKKLESKKEELSEATSVVEQIAAFSRALVDTVHDKSTVTVSSEGSVLMKTSSELLEADRSVLGKELQLQYLMEKSYEDAVKHRNHEEELEALKNSLRCKEIELEEALRSVAVKDEELKRLLQRWEERERELAAPLEGVMEEVNGFATFSNLAQSFTCERDGSLPDAAIGRLELEVAKLDVEAAMTALKGLKELSCLLVGDMLELTSS